MKNILCLSDSLNDISHFIKQAQLYFFQIEQIDPEEHSFSFFRDIYQRLKESTDLSKIDLIIAEYIEAIPLVYFMRKEGYFAPAIFIPHTNPYPLNILFYFLLVSELSHPGDVVICGSMQAARGYQHFTNIPALPICTFGIKQHYQKGDKSTVRKKFGLPLNKKILLYTGRFMNDKGLIQLLEAYDEIKNRVKNVLLVLSVNHIDPHYYNKLAPRLQDAVLFFRLEQEKIIELYQSADLFISTATSIFETYGKSPLEAISCGVPVVLPKWDGFSFFITSQNGSLANVIYTDFVEEAPYSFATVDLNDFVGHCCNWLSQQKTCMDSFLPEWAYYEKNMIKLFQLTQDILAQHHRYYAKSNCCKNIEFSPYASIVHEICSFYSLFTCQDIETRAEELGLINRDHSGDLALLKKFHDDLFKTMDETQDCIFYPQKELVYES